MKKESKNGALVGEERPGRSSKAPMAMAVRERSERMQESERERMRPSARERGENGECAGASAGRGEVVAAVAALMPSTRRRGRDVVRRARPAVAASGRRGC